LKSSGDGSVKVFESGSPHNPAARIMDSELNRSRSVAATGPRTHWRDGAGARRAGAASPAVGFSESDDMLRHKNRCGALR
jgi:hypothetical protein